MMMNAATNSSSSSRADTPYRRDPLKARSQNTPFKTNNNNNTNSILEAKNNNGVNSSTVMSNNNNNTLRSTSPLGDVVWKRNNHQSRTPTPQEKVHVQNIITSPHDEHGHVSLFQLGALEALGTCRNALSPSKSPNRVADEENNHVMRAAKIVNSKPRSISPVQRQTGSATVPNAPHFRTDERILLRKQHEDDKQQQKRQKQEKENTQSNFRSGSSRSLSSAFSSKSVSRSTSPQEQHQSSKVKKAAQPEKELVEVFSSSAERNRNNNNNKRSCSATSTLSSSSSIRVEDPHTIAVVGRLSQDRRNHYFEMELQKREKERKQIKEECTFTPQIGALVFQSSKSASMNQGKSSQNHSLQIKCQGNHSGSIGNQQLDFYTTSPSTVTTNVSYNETTSRSSFLHSPNNLSSKAMVIKPSHIENLSPASRKNGRKNKSGAIAIKITPQKNDESMMSDDSSYNTFYSRLVNVPATSADNSNENNDHNRGGFILPLGTFAHTVAPLPTTNSVSPTPLISNKRNGEKPLRRVTSNISATAFSPVAIASRAKATNQDAFFSFYSKKSENNMDEDVEHKSMNNQAGKNENIIITSPGGLVDSPKENGDGGNDHHQGNYVESTLRQQCRDEVPLANNSSASCLSPMSSAVVTAYSVSSTRQMRTVSSNSTNNNNHINSNANKNSNRYINLIATSSSSNKQIYSTPSPPPTERDEDEINSTGGWSEPPPASPSPSTHLPKALVERQTGMMNAISPFVTPPIRRNVEQLPRYAINISPPPPDTEMRLQEKQLEVPVVNATNNSVPPPPPAPAPPPPQDDGETPLPPLENIPVQNNNNNHYNGSCLNFSSPPPTLETENEDEDSSSSPLADLVEKTSATPFGKNRSYEEEEDSSHPTIISNFAKTLEQLAEATPPPPQSEVVHSVSEQELENLSENGVSSPEICLDRYYQNNDDQKTESLQPNSSPSPEIYAKSKSTRESSDESRNQNNNDDHNNNFIQPQQQQQHFSVASSTHTNHSQQLREQMIQESQRRNMKVMNSKQQHKEKTDLLAEKRLASLEKQLASLSISKSSSNSRKSKSMSSSSSSSSSAASRRSASNSNSPPSCVNTLVGQISNNSTVVFDRLYQLAKSSSNNNNSSNAQQHQKSKSVSPRSESETVHSAEKEDEQQQKQQQQKVEVADRQSLSYDDLLVVMQTPAVCADLLSENVSMLSDNKIISNNRFVLESPGSDFSFFAETRHHRDDSQQQPVATTRQILPALESRENNSSLTDLNDDQVIVVDSPKIVMELASVSSPLHFLRNQSSASRARQDFLDNSELFDSPPPPLDEIPISVAISKIATATENKMEFAETPEKIVQKENDDNNTLSEKKEDTSLSVPPVTSTSTDEAVEPSNEINLLRLLEETDFSSEEKRNKTQIDDAADDHNDKKIQEDDLEDPLYSSSNDVSLKATRNDNNKSSASSSKEVCPATTSWNDFSKNYNQHRRQQEQNQNLANFLSLVHVNEENKQHNNNSFIKPESLHIDEKTVRVDEIVLAKHKHDEHHDKMDEPVASSSPRAVKPDFFAVLSQTQQQEAETLALLGRGVSVASSSESSMDEEEEKSVPEHSDRNIPSASPCFDKQHDDDDDTTSSEVIVSESDDKSVSRREASLARMMREEQLQAQYRLQRLEAQRRWQREHYYPDENPSVIRKVECRRRIDIVVDRFGEQRRISQDGDVEETEQHSSRTSNNDELDENQSNDGGDEPIKLGGSLRGLRL